MSKHHTPLEMCPTNSRLTSRSAAEKEKQILVVWHCCARKLDMSSAVILAPRVLVTTDLFCIFHSAVILSVCHLTRTHTHLHWFLILFSWHSPPPDTLPDLCSHWGIATMFRQDLRWQHNLNSSNKEKERCKQINACKKAQWQIMQCKLTDNYSCWMIALPPVRGEI